MTNNGKFGRDDGTSVSGMRLVDEHPQQEPLLVTNLSAWLRHFRPAFQRQFAEPIEADIELIDLLRAADERRSQSNDSMAAESQTVCVEANVRRTAD